MNCRACRRPFVSDHTPMAQNEVCLPCRPGVSVTCDRCGANCPGAYDGLRKCAACRATPYLAQQQYEDRERARYEHLIDTGAIRPDGAALIPAVKLERAVLAFNADWRH